MHIFLSYLGLGVQPPIPSWGGMLAVNLVGDGLRDYLDPQSRTNP